MLELPHAAVGAAIASAFPNPAVSLPLSFLSHFATDFVPHWNPHLYSEIQKHGRISARTYSFLAGDVASAIILGIFLTSRTSSLAQSANILLCIFFAVLPDLLEIPYYVFARRGRLITSFVDFQRRNQWNVPAIPGIISQLLVIIFSLAVITA